MINCSQHKIIAYPAEKPLPAELQQWLNKHKAHTIFTSYEWFAALTQFKNKHESSRSTEFYWLFVFKSDALCLAAPLEKNGKKLKIIANFYTPFIDIFFDRSILNVEQAWVLLFTQLNAFCKSWRSLEIAPMLPMQVETLSKVQAVVAISIFKYHFSANYSINYPDFATYWNCRSSRLRNTYQRRLKKLSKQNFSIEIHSTVTDEIKRAYWQIYQQSWKVQEPSADFINWLMQWTDNQQKFKLGLLRINGVPAAFQLWLLEGATACIFKLAQDKQFDAFSPGTILTKHMIEQISENNTVRCIDFLLGDDDFKALWMDNKKNIIGAEIINHATITGKALVAVYKLRDFIKQTTGFNFSRNKIVKHHNRASDE